MAINEETKTELNNEEQESGHQESGHKSLLQSDALYQYILETSVYPREPAPMKELREITAKHPIFDENGKYHGTYDFVFVDADKDNYINYHKRLVDLVKVGGLIGYDNTLWNGSVVVPPNAPMAKYIRYYRDYVLEFNKALVADPRIEICMLPVGDGITLCRRIN
ncbi:hypothetical protein OSB04_030758 [Centaurea solstitialis]|uniref:caffeoyl-CoA O-methyltransferase n=1 Tax=Centaurea solstitialis TaxID=347529 RepID=A0AA38W450_9ASTR|nr:hypothetical protein OSB04_030758 [Centaurea solstitialis]